VGKEKPQARPTESPSHRQKNRVGDPSGGKTLQVGRVHLATPVRGFGENDMKASREKTAPGLVAAEKSGRHRAKKEPGSALIDPGKSREGGKKGF